MPTVRLLIWPLVGILAGCTASLPTEPSFTPQAARLVVHFPIGGTKATVGATSGSQQFEAYAVDTDGVWTRVTSQAEWSSSDTQAVVPSTTARGAYTYRSAGSYVIHATHQGLRGALPLDVRPAPSFPYLDLQVQSSGGGTFHTTYLMTSAATSGRLQLSTPQVTFSTSDASIAIVEVGRFLRVSPGNVIITATADGLSDYYWRSVPPRE